LMPTRWYRERKNEHYYKKAKRQGYRARSAYKLLQIQKKYDIMSPGDVVIDLGAAPGGWSQVAAERAKEVVAVDLDRMQPIDNVTFLQGDMTEDETLEQIRRHVDEADVVISDMSPELTGNYTMDQARSVWLADNALQVARELLRPNGNFVCKVFMGEDYEEFRDEVRQAFNMVKPFTPEASRKSSSEIYLVAKQFTGVQ
ncbi:MAG: RlmE family RNA methyltransferase, partial [Candidatus Thermoplasmatota archaeon]|nr:RlmE family RNA methyltransferase [Candidatus Thermoplasmatota archaeon]